MFPKVREIYGNFENSKLKAKYSLDWLIDWKRQPSWKGFYVLQGFQQINQLSKQKNAEKVAFVAIML